MKLSKLFTKTRKEVPSNDTAISAQLMVKAGYISESTAGRYNMLPLGLKVHAKVANIVRKNMDATGAQEMFVPTLHPIELWKETNRTTTTGFELMAVEDRRGATFVLGGTAEEMAVDMVRKFNLSYKDLPFNIYQFSMKFRDELRARGGLLRVREFVMKDAYSFSTEDQFGDIYQQMWDTYTKIFKEIGLETFVAAADNGYIGGEYCHEFIVESDAGESRFFVNTTNQEAAHEDVAKVVADDKNVSDELKPLEVVDAKRGTTMEDGEAFHKLPMWQQVKDVLYFDEGTKRYILAIIRGDFDVNETKLTHVADAWNLRAATPEEVREDLESEPGFISPINFVKKGVKTGYPVVIVADGSLRTVRNMYGGANKLNRDSLNMNIDRDYKPDLEGDIALAKPSETLVEKKGIEVGNIFQLGYHYTNLMEGAEYTDEKGERQKYYMGCYGIGIGRTMAALIEKYHDERGMIWPINVAPFQLMLVRLGEAAEVVKAADELYQELTAAGIEVLYDDRDARAGEKFADADLLGIPYRVVVSEKTMAAGKWEFKKRTEKDSEAVDTRDIIKTLNDAMKADGQGMGTGA
ncbi:MAG: proline--tRNA ligase [Candidatus Saccharibacteria bacterium]|nr:proline--tRNA ligase [Candidatus Saccharibacteria bacterium]